MKQVDKLILRSFIGPLVLTFLLAVFVLLMQFLWKYIDDMVTTVQSKSKEALQNCVNGMKTMKEIEQDWTFG